MCLFYKILYKENHLSYIAQKCEIEVKLFTKNIVENHSSFNELSDLYMKKVKFLYAHDIKVNRMDMLLYNMAIRTH